MRGSHRSDTSLGPRPQAKPLIPRGGFDPIRSNEASSAPEAAGEGLRPAGPPKKTASVLPKKRATCTACDG